MRPKNVAARADSSEKEKKNLLCTPFSPFLGFFLSLNLNTKEKENKCKCNLELGQNACSTQLFN